MPRLTWNDKLTIERMLKQGYSKPQIARKLGVHHSTIYDEVKRGSVEVLTTELVKKTVYAPEMSEQRHKEAMLCREQPLKIGHDHALANWLVEVIGKEHFSPAAACALMGKTPETTFSVTLCRQTIYKYIDRGYLWPLTNKELRYKGKEKRPYQRVRAARASKGDSIERRPAHINLRQEVGHWEMDSVVGKKGTKRALLVMTERATRHEIAIPVRDQTAASVVDALDKLELKYGDKFSRIFRTITCDNGSEFMDVIGLQRSLLDPARERTHVYYCHPNFPGERGSNEKQNQLIRWFFPKGTDFTAVPAREIQKAIDWINDYPRLILGWKTSRELFGHFLEAIT